MTVLKPLVEFIFELLAPDRRPCLPSCLAHKARDHSVERAAIVVLLEAELDEIAARQWSLLGPQLNFDIPVRGLHEDLSARWRLPVVDLGHDGFSKTLL